jgi:hypothetical protein
VFAITQEKLFPSWCGGGKAEERKKKIKTF